MPTPEEKARKIIDSLLTAAGWILQDKEDFNRNAGVGVAVCEFQLPAGPCDYLLFVAGKAAGVIEAKPGGTTLSGVAEQSDKYMDKLPDGLAAWDETLIFDYESTGDETFFRDMRDPTPRSRRVFAFHQPTTLLDWLERGETLRARLAALPPLATGGLRDCQVEAIAGLDASLANADPRLLIQMTMGAGKTFTACTFAYRLIKFAGAKRILFLVDRRNLGRQARREFQTFRPPDTNKRFEDLYITQLLSGPAIDTDAKVVITTIQRVYAMLRGEEMSVEDEEASDFEEAGVVGRPVDVAYNPAIPIETFDFIVTDECHRSIYGLWRQVLEYFDAFIIGLTATPTKHTLGFFGQNLVAEYPYERSVADGVNVGYEVYRVRTRVGERGGKVEAKYQVGVRDKRTRRVRYEKLDEDLVYSAKDLDRSVTAPNQIRMVMETYRDRLFTDLFPGRSWVPKTLIFAKDDHHAEEIVHIARDVFGKGNDFCKKITYRTTGEKPEELIAKFRVDPDPRIAVTVDMIATGTDIKPVEVVIFMRDVKSETYFEQMKGRGVRTILDADLRQVTPDATTKTRFILIDAVGVTESKKSASQPLERQRTVPFDKLLDKIAMGDRREDTISTLAGRLAALDRRLDESDRERIATAAGGATLRELANALLDAIDPDKAEAVAVERSGAQASEAQVEQAAVSLRDTACKPFEERPELRRVLVEIKQKSDIVIDEITTDEVLSAEYDLDQSRARVDSFREFLAANRDELLALQILYAQPHGARRLTYRAVEELTETLASAPWHLTTATVWQAYRRLESAKVRGAPADRLLTEIIALVRYASGAAELLEPFSTQVAQRFNLWIGRQKKAGREFNEEQMRWLGLIRDHIIANAAAEPDDLAQVATFTDHGGIVRAKTLFGDGLDALLDEMNGALVA